VTVPRILLINPWIHDFAAFDLWSKPLGLLYVAECLRRKGVEVALLDCLDVSSEKKYGTGHFLKQEIPKPTALKGIRRRYSRYGISEQAFLDSLESCYEPDVVLVTSMMTYWYPGAFRIIELVREHLPKTPILLGGVYATLCHEHARRFSGADHVHVGKVGKDFFELLSRYMPIDVQKKEDPVMDCRPAIDLMTEPRYGIMTTSEGCPFRCPYCASDILNPCFRQKSHERCFEEIFWMCRTLNLSDIAFYDDALLVSAKTHLIPLMEMTCESGLNTRFHVPNGLHVREITSEVAMVLKRSGFKTIRLGLEMVESASGRTLDDKTSYAELSEAISALKGAGFEDSEIGVYLLSGLPAQTREEVEESMRKVKEAGARPYLSEFSPIPGTKIWDAAREASPYPIEEEPLFQNPSLSPCAPEGYTIERFGWRRSIMRSQ
jgi:radical SAM superfamily enzyme YgiQ (UPF0313 family)